MRLLDQVAQARAPVAIEDRAGVHPMAGAADRAADVAACPLRWVLQPGVAQRCRDLLRTDAAMLDAHNMLLRAPAPHFWIEWMEWGAGRTGLLVRADESGRSGSIETFWEDRDGEPCLAQARVDYDFDRPIGACPSGEGFAIDPADHPLAAHLRLHLHPGWAEHLFREGPVAARRALGRIAVSILHEADMLFAFAAISLDRPEIDNSPVDLSRLNRGRIAKGRPALLDHLEVSLNLSGRQQGGVGMAGERSASRLHYVRGHMVRRSGTAYWRRSHLRGDLTRPIVSRTVTVK